MIKSWSVNKVLRKKNVNKCVHLSLDVNVRSYNFFFTIAGIAVEDVVTAKLVYDKYMAAQKASWPATSWS